MLRTLEIAAFSKRGLVRTRNEDSIWINGWQSPPEMSEPFLARFPLENECGLLLLADGMGGHASGDVASKFVATEIGNYFKEGQFEDITSVISEVNKKLLNYTFTDPKYQGMGSTIVGALFNMNEVTVFNIGDSRAYKIGDKIEQISTDDTLIDKKQTATHGGSHSYSHAITQCLGGYSGSKKLNPHLKTINLDNGMLLMSSDGLTDMVSIENIQFDISQPLHTLSSKLMDDALAAGGKDNIAIILARLVE